MGCAMTLNFHPSSDRRLLRPWLAITIWGCKRAFRPTLTIFSLALALHGIPRVMARLWSARRMESFMTILCWDFTFLATRRMARPAGSWHLPVLEFAPGRGAPAI